MLRVHHSSQKLLLLCRNGRYHFSILQYFCVLSELFQSFYDRFYLFSVNKQISRKQCFLHFMPFLFEMFLCNIPWNKHFVVIIPVYIFHIAADIFVPFPTPYGSRTTFSTPIVSSFTTYVRKTNAHSLVHNISLINVTQSIRKINTFYMKRHFSVIFGQKQSFYFLFLLFGTIHGSCKIAVNTRLSARHTANGPDSK